MTFWKKRFTTVLVGQLDFVPSQLYLLFQKMSRRSIKSVLELTWEKCYNVASKSSWEVTWGRCCNIASRAFSKLLTPTHPLRSITSIRRCQVRYYPPPHPTFPPLSRPLSEHRHLPISHPWLPKDIGFAVIVFNPHSNLQNLELSNWLFWKFQPTQFWKIPSSGIVVKPSRRAEGCTLLSASVKSAASMAKFSISSAL